MGIAVRQRSSHCVHTFCSILMPPLLPWPSNPASSNSLANQSNYWPLLRSPYICVFMPSPKEDDWSALRTRSMSPSYCISVAYEWGCSTGAIYFWFTSTQEPNPHIFFLCQPGIENASWGHKCDLKERPYYNNKDWGTGSVTYSCSLDIDVIPNTLLLSYYGLLLWWPSLIAW